MKNILAILNREPWQKHDWFGEQGSKELKHTANPLPPPPHTFSMFSFSFFSNAVPFTPTQTEAIRSGMQPGLTMVSILYYYYNIIISLYHYIISLYHYIIILYHIIISYHYIIVLLYYCIIVLLYYSLSLYYSLLLYYIIILFVYFIKCFYFRLLVHLARERLMLLYKSSRIYITISRNKGPSSLPILIR